MQVISARSNHKMFQYLQAVEMVSLETNKTTKLVRPEKCTFPYICHTFINGKAVVHFPEFIKIYEKSEYQIVAELVEEEIK